MKEESDRAFILRCAFRGRFHLRRQDIGQDNQLGCVRRQTLAALERVTDRRELKPRQTTRRIVLAVALGLGGAIGGQAKAKACGRPPQGAGVANPSLLTLSVGRLQCVLQRSTDPLLDHSLDRLVSNGSVGAVFEKFACPERPEAGAAKPYAAVANPGLTIVHVTEVYDVSCDQ
jgi:hypothetical protein